MPTSRFVTNCKTASLAAAFLGCHHWPTLAPPQNTHQEGIFGVLFLEGGRSAADARVSLYRQAFWEEGAKRASPNTHPDSAFLHTTSDDSGSFQFTGISIGIFDLMAVWVDSTQRDTFYSKRTGIEFQGAPVDLGINRLRPPAGLLATVTLPSGPWEGIHCELEPTGVLATSNNEGTCVFSALPPGEYVMRMTYPGFYPRRSEPIVLEGGAMVLKDLGSLEEDSSQPPPPPTGLVAQTDAEQGIVTLGWRPVPVSDLAGYTIRRRDVKIGVWEELPPVGEGTLLRDSLNPSSAGTTHTLLEYGVAAFDDSGEQSEYSPSLPVVLSRPARVAPIFPGEGEVGTSLFPQLAWSPLQGEGGEPVSYDVKLGLHPDSLSTIVHDHSNPFFRLTNLFEGTTYYWSVTVRIGNRVYGGPVWTFSTVESGSHTEPKNDSIPGGRDSDGDWIPDASDNCPLVPNPCHADTDGDGIGDACDPLTDIDGDGRDDALERCPLKSHPPKSEAADAG